MPQTARDPVENRKMSQQKKHTTKPLNKAKPKGKKSKAGMSYKDAGVDLQVYQQSMARLPGHMHRTFSPRVMKLDGGFAGLFQLDSGKGWKKRNYKDPVLVSGTDGVGTKLKLAQMTGKHDTVGIDLVAMCVNDVVCCGAEPLFFLDYVAMSHDDPDTLEQIVSGISEGCLQAGCSLLGGETAIMPDLYKRGDYDLAGFHVGVVEKKKLIDGSKIKPGDQLIGLASNGIHSNGYSLVRKIVFDSAKLKVSSKIEALNNQTVGEVLLTPTVIYTQVINDLLQMPRVGTGIRGLSHITGGGLAENIHRVLPANADIQIDGTAWKIPAVFPWLKKLGGVSPAEMYKVFNMGIGMAIICRPSAAKAIQNVADSHSIESWRLGEVVSGTGKVKINNRKTK